MFGGGLAIIPRRFSRQKSVSSINGIFRFSRLASTISNEAAHVKIECEQNIISRPNRGDSEDLFELQVLAITPFSPRSMSIASLLTGNIVTAPILEAQYGNIQASSITLTSPSSPCSYAPPR